MSLLRLGAIALLAALAVAPALAQNAQFCTANSGTTTCSYPAGTDAVFSVPSTVTSLLTLTATGGKGGTSFDAQGGRPATVSLTDVPVVPGSELSLFVSRSPLR